ncbi:MULTISPECIES: hypothetical protein [Micromonospora]|nr:MULTISPECIES: hypothetical protein [Micromonospora]WSK42811.1 hypothetical protein OG712_01015 [Micromonospora maris]
MALLVLLGVPALVVALCCGVIQVVTKSSVDDPLSVRSGISISP